MRSAADLLDYSCALQRRFEATTSPRARKKRGQFFTPRGICLLMAKWFSRPAAEYRLLDPGAGVGSLTAAVCEEFCALTSPRQLEVHLFENDAKLIDLLTQNMVHCRSRLENAGHSLRYYVHVEDFVVAASKQFCGGRTLFREDDNLGQFDGVITNPPYFKIGRDTRPAEHLRFVSGIERPFAAPRRGARCHHAPEFLQRPVFSRFSQVVS